MMLHPSRSFLYVLVTALCVREAVTQHKARVPPKIVRPKADETEIVVNVGDDVKMFCEAEGTPQPFYTYHFNDGKNPIDPSGERVQYDESTGTLIIQQISKDEDGKYRCLATNEVEFNEAVSMAPEVTVTVARIGSWTFSDNAAVSFNEGQYARLDCGDPADLPDRHGQTTFKWYRIIDNKNVDLGLDQRRFIDGVGRLHFAYILPSDTETGNQFACGISSAASRIIVMGPRTTVYINPVKRQKRQPELRYYTGIGDRRAVAFHRDTQARLECFFSGYEGTDDPAASKMPTVVWFHVHGNQQVRIVPADDNRYIIEDGSNGVVLLIDSVQLEDEGTYMCEGRNIYGSDSRMLSLNVTSAPIWVQALSPLTVTEGESAEFTCSARSAPNEISPSRPKWLRNSKPFRVGPGDQHYEFRDNGRTLLIRNVKKIVDIACFQCFVSNSEGEIFSSACLNVLLPITWLTVPPQIQMVEEGDVVDLTVVADGDVLYPLNYRWLFRNRTYDGDLAPAHVTQHNLTHAFINTTGFSDDEMVAIAGVYSREVYTPEDSNIFNVYVRLVLPHVTVPVAEAGFDFWIIGLVIGILIIVSIIFILGCVVCKRKRLEGEYLVNKKELHAGMDPEKELKDSGFGDLSRADYDPDYPDKTTPFNMDFGYFPDDNDSFASDEYDHEYTHFNEEGSFIGQYAKDGDRKEHVTANNKVAESNV